MAQDRNKRFRTILAACAAAVLLLVGSTVAYLSSRDETTNRFAAGSFDIILTETKWNPVAAENASPGDELPKNPQVTNNEKIPGYIFFRVTVPSETMTVYNDDGTPTGPAVKDFEVIVYSESVQTVETDTGSVYNTATATWKEAWKSFLSR